MSNVLVVGGKGYIGRHLQKIFPDFIYTDSKDFDLNDTNEIEDFCKNLNIELCIILSAKISYEKEIDLKKEPFLTNVIGIDNLLKTFKKLQKNPKVVYFSSMTVYSENAALPVAEGSDLKPLHTYGLSKVFAENLIKYYDFQSVIIRIPGVYGGDRKSGFIYNTIKKLQNDENIDIDTKDLGYWETIYIFNLVDFFKSFLSKYKFSDKCEIFNISYGEKTDFIQTAYFLKEQLNSKSIININREYKELYLSNKKAAKYIDANAGYYSSLKEYLKKV